MQGYTQRDRDGGAIILSYLSRGDSPIFRGRRMSQQRIKEASQEIRIVHTVSIGYTAFYHNKYLLESQ